jgi:hypothetical protein
MFPARSSTGIDLMAPHEGTTKDDTGSRMTEQVRLATAFYLLLCDLCVSRPSGAMDDGWTRDSERPV